MLRKRRLLYLFLFGLFLVAGDSFVSCAADAKLSDFTYKGNLNGVVVITGYSETGGSRVDLGAVFPNAEEIRLEGLVFKDASITEVIIPKTVSSITSSNGSVWSAFYKCESLQTVIFEPRTTETLVFGDHLFSGCKNLTSLELPDTVTSIPDYFCWFASSLSSVKLPSNLQSIGSAAFDGCTKLTSVTIPENCTVVGRNAFDDCKNLTTVTFENANTVIGENAFPYYEYVPNLVIYCKAGGAVQEYAEKNNLPYIIIESSGEGNGEDTGDKTEDDDNGGQTGGNSGNTEGITGGDGNGGQSGGNSGNTGDTAGGNDNGGQSGSNTGNASDGGDNSNGNPTPPETETKKPVKGKTYTYKNMKYKVTGASSVTFVKPSDKKIKKLTIPKTVKILGKTLKVTKINAKACYGCKKLTTVTVGNNVSTVGDQAFAKCTKLKKITFGTGLKKLGKKTFYQDKNLKNITIKSTKLKSIGKGSIKGVKKVSVKAPKKKVKAYQKLFKKAK